MPLYEVFVVVGPQCCHQRIHAADPSHTINAILFIDGQPVPTAHELHDVGPTQTWLSGQRGCGRPCFGAVEETVRGLDPVDPELGLIGSSVGHC